MPIFDLSIVLIVYFFKCTLSEHSPIQRHIHTLKHPLTHTHSHKEHALF